MPPLRAIWAPAFAGAERSYSAPGKEAMMARTQAADYDQRREEIVAQAARLYAKNGFHATSVSDLAQACDISKSAIYHYYPSKEDILFDVMHSHVLALDETARRITALSAPPEQTLRELTQGFMKLYVGAADRHKVLLNELENLPKARRELVVSLQRDLIGMVEKLLIALAPRLKKKSGEALAATMLYFGAINWTHTWFDAKGAISANALADMAVDLVLSGLKAAR